MYCEFHQGYTGENKEKSGQSNFILCICVPKIIIIHFKDQRRDVRFFFKVGTFLYSVNEEKQFTIFTVLSEMILHDKLKVKI